MGDFCFLCLKSKRRRIANLSEKALVPYKIKNKSLLYYDAVMDTQTVVTLQVFSMKFQFFTQDRKIVRAATHPSFHLQLSRGSCSESPVGRNEMSANIYI